MIGILTKRDNPLCYMDKSVWFGSNAYIVDGDKVKVYIAKENKLGIDEIMSIRYLYIEKKQDIDYKTFENFVQRFINANKDRYNYITEEAVTDFPIFPAWIWRHRKTSSHYYPGLIRIMVQCTVPARGKNGKRTNITKRASQQTINDGGNHDPDNAGDRKFDLQPKRQDEDAEIQCQGRVQPEGPPEGEPREGGYAAGKLGNEAAKHDPCQKEQE